MELSKFKKDSSFQRIKASYLDESSVELTEREAEKKKRMSHAWSLRLNNKYSTYQVIQILMRDHGISQASAYREYNMSMQIFGELDATTLAAERQVLKELKQLSEYGRRFLSLILVFLLGFLLVWYRLWVLRRLQRFLLSQTVLTKVVLQVVALVLLIVLDSNQRE